ncbi:MAG: hypothetical protein NWE98_01290 [Candidatus Bathyarchaeota archaeon]|nr:hypothetical protein [Candidatus Bathyarchaeota archaeon]
MPSIIPGYVYSLFAALAVGTIVVCVCSASAANLRFEADKHQLTNIEEYVATKSLQILSYTIQDNADYSVFLDCPPHIGNQRYWIRFGNDSSNVWVEGGFGATVTVSQSRVFVPANMAVLGSFVSGSGRPLLRCRMQNETLSLTLTCE